MFNIIRRLKNLFERKPAIRPTRRERRTRRHAARKLLFEPLGSRQVCAGLTDDVFGKPPDLVSDELTTTIIAIAAQQHAEGEGEPLPDTALDVDDDGYVAPKDALIVINQLNDPEATPNPNTDVTGDGITAPIDALVIINSLNAFGSRQNVLNPVANVTFASMDTNPDGSPINPGFQTVYQQKVITTRAIYSDDFVFVVNTVNVDVDQWVLFDMANPSVQIPAKSVMHVRDNWDSIEFDIDGQTDMSNILLASTPRTFALQGTISVVGPGATLQVYADLNHTTWIDYPLDGSPPLYYHSSGLTAGVLYRS